MSSPLNFDNTKTFRDFLISKTLNRPGGPQTFTSSNYSVQNLSNFSNVDPGDVKTNWEFYWNNSWSNNLYTQPNSRIEEYIETSLPLLVWINNGTVIQGYPQSFTPIRTNLVGIMTGQNFDDDSRLMRFATNNIRTNRQGPVFARVEQNLRTSLLGRVRVLDALNGNLSTALNLVTGRESLISRNYKITNNNSLLGKGVDFLQTVAGVELPFSTIPGDYLTNPRRPIENRPTPTSEFGAVVQDVTGVLGNLIGIQRRPKLSRKPSDLFIEYMGSGQKQVLFDQLSFSTYGPNYTTTARSQQSSRLFNVVNNFGGGVRQILGLEAPNNKSYIGDDRSEDVKYTMSDFNDNVVRSSYYLSIMFDPVQASLFERQRNISQGGPISTKLTWISKNSQNKLGLHNNEFQTVESNNFNESLSTKFGFREDSIMGKTQELLNSMPKDGLSSRTHVGNVIDQTSRIFKEGETMLSRGSSVKFVDKFNQETGAEFCRVWTKDRSYMNYSDTMKRTSNIRKFGDSIMGGNSSPWNINIAPTSSGQYDPTGKNSFGNENSTNIVKSNNGDGFYAKKYMFSFENLAWRTSNTPGFTYNDLPFCERGPNGGRVMWFPPYDLKISENNQARWQDNTFLGRPEPIYTYQDTARSGQMSFKVVVDHPSILNLLTREYFKDMSDDESENYINAFFSGCEELDFYDLIRRFAQLDSNDIRLIQSYLNNGIEPELIQQYKVNTEFPVVEDPSSNTKGLDETISTPKLVLNYENDNPDIRSNKISTSINYSNSFNTFKTQKQNYVDKLGDSLNVLSSLSPTNPQVIREKEYIFGSNITINSNDIQKQKNDIIDLFDKSENNFNTYINEINKLVQDLSGKTAQDVYIKISSSCSSAADTDYNERLAMRRSHSVIIDVFDKIKSGVSPNIKWPNEFVPINKNNGENDKEIIQQGQPIVIKKEYTFKSFGYDYDGKIIIESFNYGEGFTGKDVNPIKECIDKNFIQVPQLGIYSPIAYKCRQTTFEMNYKRTSQKTQPSTPSPTPIITLEPNGQIPLSQPIRKPSIDPLKRIIAKTLSECLYFKKIEEDDPLVFKSLKDKLKYFHPAFHSMTPEGLNARLTFLLQCIRPGDTIPIKGISEDSDLRARNTSFGPPPVCVLRIGDFYHSKVVIRDVNISYEEGGGMIWDLNPEGIGVQPMIATVTLSLNFIGGQGLTKPVERLQNALSSNFFANTEMYDERSISTLEGKDKNKYEEFKREFLGDLNRSYVNINSRPETQSINNIIEGRYMGQFVNANTESNISYNNLLSLIEIQTKTYFDKFQSTYNEIFTKYGIDITTMLLSNTYRPINKYDIYTLPLPTPGRVIDLLGLHEKSKEVSVYIERLKFVLISFINNSSSTYLVNMLGFDKEIPSSSSIILANNKILKPFFIKIVEDVIDELNDLTSLKELEHSRNELINSLDKINFVIKNGHDAVINEGVVNKVLISGFTTDFLYDEYKEFIDYIEKNHTRVVEDLTTNITFLNPTITPQDFDFIMSQMVHDKVEEIMVQFTDETLFKKTTQRQMKRRLEKFINKPEKKNFKLTRFKPLKTGKTFTYGWVSSSEETDSGIISEVKQIFSDSNEVKDKLNFYRKK
jgi:hypothetical protein